MIGVFFPFTKFRKALFQKQYYRVKIVEWIAGLCPLTNSRKMCETHRDKGRNSGICTVLTHSHLPNSINSQKEEQWGEEPLMIWMNGRSSLFKRIRRFIDSYVVWTLWMSIGVRNLNFRLSLLRRWPFSIWSLIHLNELRYSFSFDGLRLMNHNEFIRWETVMFSVLCIYEIHQISQNPMFTMVSNVLFSVWEPSS